MSTTNGGHLILRFRKMRSLNENMLMLINKSLTNSNKDTHIIGQRLLHIHLCAFPNDCGRRSAK